MKRYICVPSPSEFCIPINRSADPSIHPSLDLSINRYTDLPKLSIYLSLDLHIYNDVSSFLSFFFLFVRPFFRSFFRAFFLPSPSPPLHTSPSLPYPLSVRSIPFLSIRFPSSDEDDNDD